MSEMTLKGNVIINNVEAAFEAIISRSGKTISSFETVRKFIEEEKSTHFYFDQKMNCSAEPNRDSAYLWLDTGFLDNTGKPLFICMKRFGQEYNGHYVGTVSEITGFIKANASHKWRNDINRNQSKFMGKYSKKIADRKVAHIEEEKDYIVTAVNSDATAAESSDFALKLAAFRDLCPAYEEEAEEPEVVDNVEEFPAMSEEEEAITISILLDKLEEVQDYVQTLQQIIEENVSVNEKNQATINELKAKTKEYEQAMVQMRTFAQCEQEAQDLRDAEKESNHPIDGHDLLNNKKILVLGQTDISTKDMQGIAKNVFGFDKKDIEFETDYKKVVHASGRIQDTGRYQAIIFGCVPHKVKNTGDWSGIINQYKNSTMITVDARTNAGGLKVTKSSFREALSMICRELSEEKKAIA